MTLQRVRAANRRPSFVYAATSRLFIQKLAGRAVNIIFAMTQYPFAPADFCKTFLCLLGGDVEMPRQTPNIHAVYADHCVTATVGRALIAIVKNAQLARFLFSWVVFCFLA